MADEREVHAGVVPRVLNGVLGVALLLGAALGARDGLEPAWRGVALGALGVVGLEALVSAVRGTRSWLSRLGPSP